MNPPAYPTPRWGHGISRSIKERALLHFRTPPSPYCYWWLIMKKRGWKLYHSPNPNPWMGVGVQKCNMAPKQRACGNSGGQGVGIISRIQFCRISRAEFLCLTLKSNKTSKYQSFDFLHFSQYQLLFSKLPKPEVDRLNETEAKVLACEK